MDRIREICVDVDASKLLRDVYSRQDEADLDESDLSETDDALGPENCPHRYPPPCILPGPLPSAPAPPPYFSPKSPPPLQPKLHPNLSPRTSDAVTAPAPHLPNYAPRHIPTSYVQHASSGSSLSPRTVSSETRGSRAPPSPLQDNVVLGKRGSELRVALGEYETTSEDAHQGVETVVGPNGAESALRSAAMFLLKLGRREFVRPSPYLRNCARNPSQSLQGLGLGSTETSMERRRLGKSRIC